MRAPSLERADHPALMGDVPFPTMDEALSLMKKLFHSGAFHPGSLPAQNAGRADFLMPVMGNLSWPFCIHMACRGEGSLTSPRRWSPREARQFC
jgi:hypothetical protein